jgi:hypothetical protein
MDRSQIPARLRADRAHDCARIPSAALKSMTPADVAPRLLAHDEYVRRARVPHLDGDLLRHRLGLAREVLTTADPRRAAELIAKAGVSPGATAAAAGTLPGQRRPLPGQLPLEATTHTGGWGTHQHRIADCQHIHVHTHRGDNDHSQADHHRPGSQQGLSPSPPNAAPSTGIKSAGRSVTVPTPALNVVAHSSSLDDGLTKLNQQGRLGEAAAELGRLAAAAASLKGLSKAVHYREQAARVSDPEMRSAYLQMARELESAGAR